MWCFSSQPVAKASYTKSSGNVDFGNTKAKKQASILPALCKAFGPTFVFGSILKLIQDSMTFVSPIILGYYDPHYIMQIIYIILHLKIEKISAC